MSSADPEDQADLFGDEENEDALFGDEDQARSLNDEALDSGDDEGREDRLPGDSQQVEIETRAFRVMDVGIARQLVPNPSDGQLHLLRVPRFLGIDPKAYDAENFTLPTTDHHSATPSEDFSPSATALTTMRYRKNPQTGELESNTVLSRWSDGSYTISIGDKSYSLMSKQLAPPIGPDGKDYQDVLDSHTYLATPYMDSEVFHIVGHMTNQFTVDANQEVQDHALERLKAGMAAAARGTNKDDNKGGLALINTSQDPELQKKQAEMAEKERAKAQRRRETAALRADQQAGRIRGSLGGGLTLDDLEKGGSRGLGSAKKKRSAPSGPKRARRRPDYDSDDDLPAGRRGKEDEYDLEDDFLAPSDEEEEAEEDDEESEEEVDEGSEGEREPKKRKVEQDADADGESDPDADGEVDDTGAGGGNGATGEAAAAAARARKRHVIEDDEDE